MLALAVAISTVLVVLGWSIAAVLYAPWRVKPLTRLLYARSAWYRSWYMRHAMRRIARATRRLERTIGQRLMPAMQEAARSTREWLEAMQA